MGYATPHHAHEFMKAIALQVIHDFNLHCQRRSIAQKKDFLISKREIDLHAMVLRFFGPEASLYAQGVAGIDLAVTTPRIDVEFKYLRKQPSANQPVNGYPAVMGDWAWLLGLNNNNRGRALKQSCWVVFLPSRKLFDFHSNFTVPAANRPFGLTATTYAPFMDIVEPHNATQLKYRATAWATDHRYRDVILVLPNAMKVRRQIVGNPDHPIWCLIFSRITAGMERELDGLIRVNATEEQ